MAESINNYKLCKTNPISEKPKMVVTSVITRTYNNEQLTMNYLKQTQSNPISERALTQGGQVLQSGSGNGLMWGCVMLVVNGKWEKKKLGVIKLPAFWV
jgi:hypothetical protein